MDLPPGAVYILHLIAGYYDAARIYFFLQLLQAYQPSFHIPFWWGIAAFVLSRPVFLAVRFYSTSWANKRTAAELGAVIPPVVQDSSISVVKQMAETSRVGYPCDMMYQLSLKYGNIFQFELFQQRIVVTMEPEHVKAILATQFESFDKGPVFIDQMDSLLGTGVFNTDGEMWKFHRSMTRPFFTRERISDFEIYHRNCNIALRAAKGRLAEGLPLNFQDLVSRFTLDSATEFLFGHMVGSLEAGLPYPPSHTAQNSQSLNAHPSTAFVKAFGEGQVLSLCRLGYGPEWRLVEFGTDKVKPLRKIIDEFAEPLMTEALERLQREVSGEKAEEDSNLLAHLVRHTQDRKVLKDELMNLLVAGRDTTGSLLTFAFYMLTQHPDIERRLREEIFEKIGPVGNPTYEHMREMKFMRAFLNEVLRLYPPVPADSRCANKDVTLPPRTQGRNQCIFPRTLRTLVYHILNTQRRTDLWGPDAMQFDPDRFLDERLHKYLVPNPYIFFPFNAGPRICLGQQFAYHEATFFLVRLLQEFTGFALDDSNAKPPADWAQAAGRKGTEKVHLLSHLTMYVKDGLWVRMQELNTA
ncbi:cytochrome P450 [Pholiota molesta]|nr:cytochrome P450 [Pholiota molesta]